MIRALIGTAFAGLLLAGCAMPQNTTSTAAASPKPACDRHSMVTGSHMMGDCDYKNVEGANASAIDTAMRQNPSPGVSSH
jgi:uncharacterized lipoprotein YajG